ncbi:unnamed protein product [Dibothriocephalus latus]|uniref:Uncharacterized protein n=1 Tax=Dibothriocephalus latus TaxID=60516 RepID=A0A3P7P436_DIBLA|nr:unnamed protein product [Dibothriocephalus latus]
MWTEDDEAGVSAETTTAGASATARIFAWVDAFCSLCGIGCRHTQTEPGKVSSWRKVVL